jgi:GAF domain-containing protein/anti-sigma regulatory factor (Ser/Thr protein kinase)
LEDLEHQLAQKQAQLTALGEIGRALNSAWALEPTLDLISRQTTQIMGVDSCSIYLLQPDGAVLILKATTGLALEAVGRATLRLGEGLTGWAAREGRPVAVRDAAADSRFKLLPETQEKGLRSLAAVPLTNQGRVIGAMNVQTARFHDFDGDEIELLALIGDLAAGALEKAALYDNMKRQIQELSTLAEVSQTVTSPLYLDEMLGVVVEMATQVTDAKVCSLMLMDEAGEALLPVATQPDNQGYTNRPPIRVGQGVTGGVAQSGQPAVVADVQVDPRYLYREMAREEGLVSLLSVPLTVRDKVIGVFNLYTGQPHDFTAKEQVFFQTLANQTALAIENARLVAGAAIVREMHHRVKNNLQTIAMLLRLQMSDGPDRPASAVLPEAINRILAIAAVHETLSESGLRMVDVRTVLSHIGSTVIQNLSDPHKRLHVSVEGDGLVLPSQAATALALATNELIQNALEHAFVQRESGHVKVLLQDGGDVLTVSVVDDGVGMETSGEAGPAPGLPNRSGAPERSADVGLGLEIVTTLVTEDLKGSFDLGADESGTRATIRLPRPGSTYAPARSADD